MASVFKRIQEEADVARRSVERLTGAIPGGASFPVAPGGGGGVPVSVARDIALIASEMRRMRTAGELPDPRLQELLRGE